MIDVGADSGASGSHYPDYAVAVAEGVRASKGEALGILICGTGIGMSMVANKHKGIRAALCGDTFSARMTREHNNANVLCMGARVIGPGLMKDITDLFLDTPFEAGGRHEMRVNMITDAEREGNTF
jgi:ribose 5-phosphate isomerase B